MGAEGAGAVAPEPDVAALLDDVERWAHELGFQQAAVSHLDLGDDVRRLDGWLARGRHGTMTWMERHRDLRTSPAALVPGTLSVISVRMDYLTEPLGTAMAMLDRPGKGYVARYALGRDYHKTLRSRLRRLAARMAERIGPFGHRVFTDSAPVLERALARNGGLGWIGKHTNLIDRHDGSLFFIGEIFTDLRLPASGVVETNHCGSCARCIDVCPTGAIVAPFELDARRCISYLTIEHDGPIPEALRPLMGNRVFGCDDCQLVCPWNRYAKRTPVADFEPRHELDAPDLVTLFDWDETEFERVTRGSALRRVTHEQWLRNVAVALGNTPGEPAVVQSLARRREHRSEIVREHVRWALDRHGA